MDFYSQILAKKLNGGGGGGGDNYEAFRKLLSQRLLLRCFKELLGLMIMLSISARP